MDYYTGTFYHVLAQCLKNTEKREKILSTESLINLNIPEAERFNKIYRLELFNLCLSHELPSLSLSIPPEIKDFESEYVKWFKRNEALAGKEVCECKVWVDNGIYGKYQLLNYGEEWKQLISEDFNEYKIQIGFYQSLYISAFSPQSWSNDYIQLMGNYRLIEEKKSTVQIRLETAILTINAGQRVQFPQTNNGYLSLNIKNEGEEIIKIFMGEYLLEDRFIYLKAKESYCLDREYPIKLNIWGQMLNPVKSGLVSFVYGY